jgi:hypothetical protein
MVVGRGPVALGVESRIDEADVRQQSLGHGVDERQGVYRDAESVRVAIGERMPEREVLRAPQGQEGQIPEEVPPGGNSLAVGDRRELVPDGRQRRDGGRVMVPVSPGRVLVEAVREGLAGERAEVAVQDGVVLSQCPDDREVGNGLAAAVTVVVRVVTDRECVGGCQRHSWIVGRGGGPLQESVHFPAVALDQEALPAVVGVAVPAALKVRGQWVVRIDVAVRRQVGHVVAAVGSWQPAEEMVERPVLHHEHHHVLDTM